jgi:hypothetical protein
MFYEQDSRRSYEEDILRFIKNSFDRFRTKFIREDEHESRLISSFREDEHESRLISSFTRTLTRH